MTKLHELAELGQAIWLDYIRRAFTLSGELQALIDLGLRGMTSNPSIFEKAIVHSADYDADLQALAKAGKSEDEIYTSLVVDDIRRAADLFRPVYESTARQDGYVSLEVSPLLAHDGPGTLAEAKRLWARVDRPNLMVKIPATEAGLPAIEGAIAAGINVNVTLIFSLERYGKVMAAYIAGLEQRLDSGLPVDHIHSVASFFVSRVDSKIDPLLEEIVRQEGPQATLAARLRGQAAVANARMAYQQFKAVFGREEFARLQAKGANPQRPLWASTSTKNPAYPDVLYVQELIGPFTVNTVPQETLDAFLDHGEPRQTLDSKLDETRFVLQSLESLGISMAQVTQTLEEEGVAAFAKSFASLMDSVQRKRQQFQAA